MHTDNVMIIKKLEINSITYRGRPRLHVAGQASASSEYSRSLRGDGGRAGSPFVLFLIGDHGVWGPCRGILYFIPLSESKSTRTVVSNAVGVCAISTMKQFLSASLYFSKRGAY